MKSLSRPKRIALILTLSLNTNELRTLSEPKRSNNQLIQYEKQEV